MRSTRKMLIQFIVSLIVGLSIVAIAIFNPYHLSLLERVILAFIGITVVLLF